MPEPLFYPSHLNACAGDEVSISASATCTPCTLEISRLGAKTELACTINNIAVGNHPTPADADTNGCNWPPVASFKIADDWRSGYYDLKLSDAQGEDARAAAIGCLSWRQLLVQSMFATAPDAPRLINETARDYKTRPRRKAWIGLRNTIQVPMTVQPAS